jgi:lipopolysaccharide/colanic/teichoic acid biosynthesis glycosyltransferase
MFGTLSAVGEQAVRSPVPKQIVDRLISGALLLLLSPLVLVAVVAMAVDAAVSARDRGSVLYREPRISRGRTFEMLKFRTLRRDALAEMRYAGSHARLYEADPANLTWVGRRILKPWYLDEIPQLLNVLRGDISLVGPRPWPPEMVAGQVAEGEDYRNEILAGLTGPAQVTKGSGLRYADLDLGYVELCRTLGGWALARYDLRILWQTVRVMARGEGLSY